jgi:hypothetical protein
MGMYGLREMRNAYKILVGELGKSNTKMDLKETGCEVMDWIRLAQDRIPWCAPVNTLMNFRIHKRRNFFTT